MEIPRKKTSNLCLKVFSLHCDTGRCTPARSRVFLLPSVSRLHQEEEARHDVLWNFTELLDGSLYFGNGCWLPRFLSRDFNGNSEGKVMRLKSCFIIVYSLIWENYVSGAGTSPGVRSSQLLWFSNQFEFILQKQFRESNQERSWEEQKRWER